MTEVTTTTKNSFENLNLHASIVKAIAETGYTEPTQIQAEAIPLVLAGEDLMASSQTGYLFVRKPSGLHQPIPKESLQLGFV